MATGTSTEVTKRGPSIETLRDIQDFESAVKLLQAELGAEVVSSAELGDGFTLEENKDALVGVPCMFVAWSFSTGDYGPFVAARVVAQLPNKTFRKVVIVDGSTGIFAQLKDISERRNAPSVLVAQKGLRKSEYKVPIENKETGEVEMKPSTTYYVDTSS